MDETTDLNRPIVGIIGGTGKMGRWFAGLLRQHGSTVHSFGQKTNPPVPRVIQRCEVVVISVPIARTMEVIRKIGPMVSEDALLMDLTSIKKEPVDAMLSHSRSEVVGAHPLFGADEASTKGLTVVVCPGRGQRGFQWLCGLLKNAGFAVTILTPEAHDRMMGLAQGVNHLSTLAFGLCIVGSGIPVEDLMSTSTLTFRERLDRIRTMANQSPELFGSLLMDNSSGGELMDQYMKALVELSRIIKEKDRKGFVRLFHTIQEGFGVTGSLISPESTDRVKRKPELQMGREIGRK
jgi:prephenate dehydrogenase